MAVESLVCEQGHPFAMETRGVEVEDLTCPRCGSAVLGPDEDDE